MTIENILFKDFLNFLNEKSSSTSKFTDYKIMLITKLYNEDTVFMSNNNNNNNNNIKSLSAPQKGKILNERRILFEHMNKIKASIVEFIAILNTDLTEKDLKQNFNDNVISKIINLLSKELNNIIAFSCLKSYFDIEINHILSDIQIGTLKKLELTPYLFNFIKELIENKLNLIFQFTFSNKIALT